MNEGRPSVLIVEDNEIERKVVDAVLASFCNVVSAATLAEAHAKLLSQSFSLIILDGALPDGDGFAFCEALRQDPAYKTLPIICLTGRSAVHQRVSGLSAGADDYIVKPLEPAEFKARVKAQLRRSEAGHQKTFVKGRFHVDLVAQQISINDGGSGRTTLNLTPIETKIMLQFLQNEGKVFSRDELMRTIWGGSTHVSSHTVDSHISSLRKKMGASSKCIKAIVRQGYRFTIAS